jgi:16S rRNA (adenine1518-N6/adenine1519-N6)-dimethyltransferase
MEIQPKKSLGQNFLINAGILEKIVSAAELSPDDTVLEIGPGTGNLTKLLFEKSSRVIAVEKDCRLIEDLKIKFPAIKIVEEDALEFKPEEHGLKEGDYKIVANIPYYITSILLRTIFEKWPKPKLIVLTVQKEVAKRITAKPPDMSLLALSVQFYVEPKIVGYVSRGSFRPMPKVDSAIIKLTPRIFEVEPPTEVQPRIFFKVAKAGFSGKRKQLINNLVKNSGMIREDTLKIFETMGIEPDIRAENLSLNQWIELSKLMEK